MVYSGGNSEEDKYTQQVNIALEADDTKFTSTLTKASKAVNSFGTTVQTLKGGLDGLNQFVIRGNQSLIGLSKTLGGIESTAVGAFKVFGSAQLLGTAWKGFRAIREEAAGLNRALMLMQSTGFSTEFFSKIETFKDSLLGSFQATEQTVYSAIGLFNRYQESLNSVKVLFTANSKFANELSQNIRDVVNNDLNNAITSVQALSAAYEAASAGFKSAAENNAVMTAGLKLAKAGGADTGATMRALTQTIRAYNMTANDSYKVAALLNATIQEGITTMPELANGFAQTAVVAKEAGVSIEQLSAAVASLTLKGSSTAGALTGLESLFRSIINKTPEAAKALRELRTESGKALRFDIDTVKTQGLGGALQELNEALKGNVEQLRKIFPESNAFATALALMANNAQDLIDKTKGMEALVETGAKARKALDEVFGIKLEGQAASFEAIINKTSEFFIELGETFAPALGKGINILTRFLDIFQSLPEPIKEAAENWLVLQVGLKSGLTIFGGLLDTIKNVAIGFVGFRLSLSLLNGELFKAFTIVPKLIASQAGIIPIIKQILGVNQSYLVATTNVNAALASRTRKLELLREQQADSITYFKQWLGLDQSAKINLANTNLTLDERNALIDEAIRKNKEASRSYQAYNKLLDEQKQREEALLKVKDKINAKSGEQQELLEQIQVRQEAIAQASAKGRTAEVEALNEEIEAIKNRRSENELVTQTYYEEQIKAEEELAKAKAETLKQEKIVNDYTESVRQKYIATNEAYIDAEKKATEAVEARRVANIAQGQALAAQKVATDASTASTATLEAATLAEQKASELNAAATKAEAAAEAANAKAKKLSRDLSIQQGVAEGRLIKVRTVLGEVTIANNIATKLFFGNFLGTKAVKVITDLTLGMTLLNARLAAGNVINFTFKTAWKGIGLAVKQVGTYLLALNPLTLALIPVVALLGSYFTGYAADLRGVNKEIDKMRKEGLVEIKDLLAKNQEKVEATNKAYATQNSILEGTTSSLTKSNQKLAESFETSKKGLKTTSDYFGDFAKAGGNAFVWLGDKIIDVLNPTRILQPTKWVSVLNKNKGEVSKFREALSLEAEAKTIETLTRNFNLISERSDESTKALRSLRAGLTGIAELDEKIRAGQKLTQKERTAGYLELQGFIDANNILIAQGEKELAKIGEQLEKNTNKNSEGYKKLRNQQDAVIARNEKLKDQNKDLSDFRKFKEEQDRGLEAIQANYDKNTKVIVEGQNRLTTEGNSNLEISMRENAAQAEMELDNFGNALTAKLNGQSQTIEKFYNEETKKVEERKVDLDIETMLGKTPPEKLRKAIASNIDGINDLLNGGYISAEEAANRYNNLFDKQFEDAKGKSVALLDLLDPKEKIEAVNQAVKAQAQATSEAIDKINKETELANAQVAAGLKTEAEIREDNLKRQLEVSDLVFKRVKGELEFKGRQRTLTKEEEKKLNKELEVARTTYNSVALQLAEEQATKELDIAQRKNQRLLNLQQAYSNSVLRNQEDINIKIAELQEKQTKIEADKIRKRIELIKDTASPEVLEELNNKLAIADEQAAQASFNRKLLVSTKELALEEKKNAELLKLNQAYSNSLLRNQEEVNIKIISLQEKQARIEADKIRKRIELAKDVASPEILERLNNQLAIVEEQASQASFKQKLLTSNKELALEEKKNAELIKLTQVYSAARIGNEFETATKLIELQRQQLINTRDQLIKRRELLKKEGADKQILDDIEREIKTATARVEVATLDVTRTSLNQRLALYKKNSERIAIQEQNIVKTLEMSNAKLAQENKLLGLRKEELDASVEIEQSRLELQLKTTNDLVKRAEIQKEQVENETEAQIKRLEFEQESLRLQQTVNKLATQRALIENNIAKIRNNAAVKELEVELKKARLANQSPATLRLLEAQLESRKLEGEAIVANRGLLIREEEIQNKITQSNLKRLEVRKQLAEDGGIIAKEQAANNIILAQLEKQIQQINLRTQAQELNFTRQDRFFKFEEAQENRRAKFIKLEQERQAKNEDVLKKQLGIFSQLTGSRREQQKIAEAIAKREFDTLAKRQEAERKLLEIQIKQNERALERQEIEAATAALRAKSEILTAQAEANKVKASRTATEEEKQAADLSIKLAEEKFNLALQALGLAKEQREDERIISQQQRESLKQQQALAREEARANVALSTGGRRDDRNLAKAYRNTFGAEVNRQVKRKAEQFGLGDNIRKQIINIPELAEIAQPQIPTAPTNPVLQNLLSNLPTTQINSAAINPSPIANTVANLPIENKAPIEVIDRSLLEAFTNSFLRQENINVRETNRGDDNKTSQSDGKFSPTVNVTINVSKEDAESGELTEQLRSATLEAMYDVLKKTNIELGNY